MLAAKTSSLLALAGLLTAVGGILGGIAGIIAAVSSWHRHPAPDSPPAADADDHDALWVQMLEQLEHANAENVALRAELRRSNAARDKAQAELIAFLREAAQ